MTSTAVRVSLVGACTLGLLSCSSSTTPHATPGPSVATESAIRANDRDVTDRARAALTGVGAQQLAVEPGYEDEANTMFTGVFRASPLIAYVVPTAALPSASDITVVAERNVKGQAVDVVRGEDSTVQMLRFVLGPDTWLVASPDEPTASVPLVAALLGQAINVADGASGRQ